MRAASPDLCYDMLIRPVSWRVLKDQDDQRPECGKAENSLLDDPRYDGPTEIYTGNECGDR
jgi:hypothetical protein